MGQLGEGGLSLMAQIALSIYGQMYTRLIVRIGRTLVLQKIVRYQSYYEECGTNKSFCDHLRGPVDVKKMENGMQKCAHSPSMARVVL